ncbi:FimV family protein [Chitinimonas arctica]|uniref:FimV family protein n=1 Tax=Chitinimonas arctica TaxID=2594795 RepID=A0A516SB18_9NEIS|nr:FimV/HubP family polar landmark protein [Chitinimonas arctica]QDQ25342.1 FimV family protein [Chitinimonas arctica]
MAVALATIPAVVHSAGLGRLNVLSGLGQPLRAEIDLVAVQAAEVESLRAALATPESYREAQIEYPSTSLGLRFNLEKRSNGQYFIAVNSAQSVNEPFLDFLIELKWDGGRVLREYSALLDPVGYTPGASTAAAPSSRPASAAPSVIAPASKPPLPAKPEPVSKPQAAKKAEPSSEPRPEGEQTYTVKSGDTLAAVAHMNMVEGVSLEQMLVGLYRANQDAFDGKNMNRLKKGRVLNIPGKDELSAVERSAANKEIRVQAEDWRAYRAKLADNAGASRAEPSSGSGKITAKVEDKAKSLEPAAKDTLKLSKGEDGKLREKVLSLEEESAARQKALGEANQRVSDLERTNKKLEELLALKSKQGADLQKQAEQAKNSLAKPELKPVEPKPLDSKPALTAPEPLKVEPPPADKPLDAAPTATPAAVEPPPPVEPPVAEPPPKPKKKILVPISEPEPEPSMLEDPLILGGAGLAALLIGGGAFWMSRRRKKGSFEDSVITGSDLKSNTMVGNTGGAVISTGVTENSFLTDFSRAGLGTIDTDEVDPIAEAEVYMAYGRDAQAEEILKDALTRDGTRQEVRLKLLEIYSGRKNAAAFETTAQELYSGTQGQGPLWAQAADMGRALDPQNTLYRQQAPVDTGALDKTMILSAGTLGEMGDTGRFATPVVERVQPASAEPELDFQLDTPVAQAKSALEAGESLDFDLGFDAAPASAAAPAVEAPAEMDFNIGDFDLDAPASKPAATPAAAASAAAASAAAASDSSILSLDIPIDLPGDSASSEGALDLSADMPELSMPELSMPKSSQPLADLDTPDLAAGLDFDFDMNDGAASAGQAADLGGVSLDLDIASDSAGGDDVLDFGAELDDPVTTKIDLARAYIDMGDKEGAREILQEALSEGNAEQKGTAESLLAQL